MSELKELHSKVEALEKVVKEQQKQIDKIMGVVNKTLEFEGNKKAISRDDFIKLIDEGYTATQISHMHNISRQAVYQRVKKLNLKFKELSIKDK